MAGAHVQIYLWTFDRGWPQKYIIQKSMSAIYDVNVEGNSLVMCSCARCIQNTSRATQQLDYTHYVVLWPCQLLAAHIRMPACLPACQPASLCYLLF
jgi:hypothetical protein